MELELATRLLGFATESLRVAHEERLQRLALEGQLYQAHEREESAAERQRITENARSLISHEIRTPLASILGFVDLLLGVSKENDNLTEKQKEYLLRIRKSAEHLHKLVNEVLLYQKPLDKITIEPERIRVGTLCHEAVALLEPQALNKHLELKCECPAEDPWVFVDQRLVSQILNNLVGNAIKFTPSGSVVVQVAVEDSDLVIMVRDTGIGMSEDDLSRIFEPFYRSDSSYARTSEGMGLGLNIVKKMLDKVGGTIAAESWIGLGSVFTVTLHAAVPDW